MVLPAQIFKRTLQQSKSKSNFLHPHHHRSISLSTSFSTVPSFADAPPQLPPFPYEPKPYNGPSADQILLKRKKYLGPSLFYYYQKPVCYCFSFSLTPFVIIVNCRLLDMFLFYFFLIMSVICFVKGSSCDFLGC